MTTDEMRIVTLNYDTPCYVYDIDLLNERMDGIRSVLSDDIDICFAIKANPFVVKEMSKKTSRLEVCSPGEMEICINCGISPEKILMSGVNKTKEDIEVAVNYGVYNITAESVKHMELISAVAEEKQTTVNVYPRLTAGSQFGIDETELFRIIEKRDEYPFCNIKGIHYFVGTQRKKASHQIKDIEKIQAFLERIENVFNFKIEELEYGPGLYYPYFDSEPLPDFSQLEELNNALTSLKEKYKITVESGRYFVAQCGYYFTAVVDTKNNGNANYAIVDGGINHLSYYGGSMGMKVPHFTLLKNESVDEKECKNTENWTLCGSLCTTADVLIRAVELNSLECGDIFVFENTGAYSATESSGLFLSRKLPTVIKKENGKFKKFRDNLDTSIVCFERTEV